MSETTQASVPAPPAAPAAPAEQVLHPGEARHAAAGFPVELKAAFRDHAGTCFDVAGDVLAVLKTADPGDASALALTAKVLAMAESAAKIAGAVHTA